MVKEEIYHRGTGNNGLLRIIKARIIEPEMIQKFFNNWVPTVFDLLDTDGSSSAHWAYVWGLKGRFDERNNRLDADQGALNETSRGLYRDEVVRLVERLNRYIDDRDRWLMIPDMKFNRSIGNHAHQPYSVDGDEIRADRYPAYLASVLPSDQDYKELASLQNDNVWIEPRKAA